MRKYSLVVTMLFLLAASSAVAQEYRVNSNAQTEKYTAASGLKAQLEAIASKEKKVVIGFQVQVKDKFKGVHSYKYDITGNRNSRVIINGKDRAFNDENIDKAVLFQYSDSRLRGIFLVPLNRGVFPDSSYFWLKGVSSNGTHMALVQMLKDSSYERIRDEILMLLAVEKGEEGLRLVEEYIFKDVGKELKEEALQWTGFALLPERFAEFKKIASRINDPELIEELPFLYHNAKSEEAMKELLVLAKKGPNIDVREDAVFWLGVIATKKLAEEYGITREEKTEEIETQEHSVFVLSQMDTPKSRAVLLRLARTGKSYYIRKAALFWLCQEHNHETLSYLEELVAS